jgi:hypothetical protein
LYLTVFHRYIRFPFCPFLVVGEKISFPFYTTDRDQDFAHFHLFCSSSINPKYVDETGCKEHGKFSVEIQKHSRDFVDIEVTFQFGLTELIVSNHY